MPAASATPAIIERLDAVRCDVTEIKASITNLTASYNEFKVQYAKAHEQLESRTAIALDMLEDQELRIDALEALVKPMVFQSRLVAFIGSSLLIVLIGFLFAILTHQVTIGVH